MVRSVALRTEQEQIVGNVLALVRLINYMVYVKRTSRTAVPALHPIPNVHGPRNGGVQGHYFFLAGLRLRALFASTNAALNSSNKATALSILSTWSPVPKYHSIRSLQSESCTLPHTLLLEITLYEIVEFACNGSIYADAEATSVRL